MKVPHRAAHHEDDGIYSTSMGSGDPIPRGGMIVSEADGMIVWVGAYPSLPSKYNNVTFTKHKGALMPGMCTSFLSQKCISQQDICWVSLGGKHSWRPR